MSGSLEDLKELLELRGQEQAVENLQRQYGAVESEVDA